MNEMKVYAKYYPPDKHGYRYRKSTLLQFGDSWELIGSAVLINPGSSEPKPNTTIAEDVLHEICKFTNNHEDSEAWHEFKDDPTMRWLANIFAGQYIEKRKPLNGVIQLFNLFNLIDKDLGAALHQFGVSDNEHLLSIDKDVALFKDKPVYLGWGTAGKTNKILNEKARLIHEHVFNSGTNPYLKDKFEDNSFYHPRFVNMSNGKLVTKALMHNYYHQTSVYKPEEFGVTQSTKIKFDDDEMRKIFKLFDKFTQTGLTKSESDKKMVRYRFNGVSSDIMEFTLTFKEGGFVGIRGAKPGKGQVWNSNLKSLDQYKCIADSLDNESGNTWVWRKSFGSYQMVGNELVECIIKDLKSFRKRMF
jgi:hypothetical protein